MAKKTLAIIIELMIVLACCQPGSADTITIAADPWMPYTGDGKNQNGFILDIAKEIFRESGHTVRYIVLPWERAILSTREGKCDALASCFKTEAPDFIFPSNEQGVSTSEIFVRKAAPWTYSGINSLKSMRIGIISGYSYGPRVDSYIRANKKNRNLVWVLVGEDALIKGLRMLNLGRIDALIEDTRVVQYTSRQLNLSGEFTAAGKVMAPEKLWIGFSPANAKSKTFAGILSEGMVKIRQSGRLDQILNKYGLSDWQGRHANHLSHHRNSGSLPKNDCPITP